MVDYSKWKDIEISDDEDDTHPNIDTPSLFRWRHQARMERMAEHERERSKIQKEKKDFGLCERPYFVAFVLRILSKKDMLRLKMKEAAEQAALPTLSELERELAEIEKDEERFRKLEEEIEKKEKLAPWNVDTISQEGFTKTVINTGSKKKDDDLTEEERERLTQKFYQDNESLLKKYGMLKRFEDSKKILTEHPQLVCEDTANYLVLWCINLCIEDKEHLMNHVAHQVICMQFILELAKQLDLDPRSCVTSFFNKIQMADEQYQVGFESELTAFKDRVKKRAEEKIRIATEQVEEEERQKRLGPGGLDPVEVFEALPPELQKCFESKDTELLKKTLAEMPVEEAKYHMKRCVDSGMWIPPADEDEPVDP
ncbi:unnamed protein product [Notodromas monacha]|uniref:Hsp90 co-chaperone Cdc37 n=1 Tax=Notodromas monacha TaxID=399045 RepID=A0A7R9BVX6_9CRUS|nr:unnamed protein product [Notodromas monacha]CAG0922784.1 unnamed protein product [Notodromas monacha]